MLEKSHSSSTRLVSQTSTFITGGVSCSHERQKTTFSLHHPHHLCNEGLYFLPLSLKMNFLDLVRVVLSYGKSLESLFTYKGLSVWVANKILLVDGQTIDALNWKSKLKKKNLDNCLIGIYGKTKLKRIMTKQKYIMARFCCWWSDTKSCPTLCNLGSMWNECNCTVI